MRGRAPFVQSVIIPKSWSIKRCIAWLDKHGFIHPKVHTTANYHRFRQLPPRGTKYYMVKLRNGIGLVVKR